MLCGASIGGDATADHAGEGGSTPTAPLFRRADWWVRPVPLDVARALVEAHHYALGASNTAVYCHGLMPRDSLWCSDVVGAAWWIPPTKSAARAAVESLPLRVRARGATWKNVLALSRLVVRPDVPPNACSFLVRHSMRQIDRRAWPVLLTYADGWRGHVGTIYRAAGWTDAGETAPERCYTLHGRMLSRKAGPKTRTHAEMLAIGCVCEGSFSKQRFLHVAQSHEPLAGA